MTVSDCIGEYKSLHSNVFEKPRFFSTLRFGVGDRSQYEAARLEKTFKNIIARHAESELCGSFNSFPSGRGLCKT